MLGLVSGFIAGQEWIIIIVLAAVLIFGAKKIPELAKTFGKAKGEFEKGKIEGDNELKEFKDLNATHNIKSEKIHACNNRL